MTVETVRTLFAELRAGLLPLIAAIRARPEHDDRCLTGDVSGAGAAGIRREDHPRVRLRLHARPAGQDRASVHDEAREGRRADHDAVPRRQPVGRAVLDAARGRPRDVRAGHRRRARRHAALHAARRQASTRASRGCGRTSSAAACRSGATGTRPLKAAFPGALDDVDVDTFYRAINKVAPSLIRTDADEVTYNLHVMLRFDLELALLEGTLAVADLPEAWRARMRERPRRRSRRRPRRGAAGRPLVRRHRRRRVPELHARQHHERAVLRRGAP